MSNTLDRIELDYAQAQPRCHRYYIPFLYQKRMPEIGSLEYYKFLELLKFLETIDKFNPAELCCFLNEVNE